MKKILIIAIAILVALAAIMCFLVCHMSKPADEVMAGPKNAEHVLTREFANSGYSVSRGVQERAGEIDNKSLQKIQDALGEIGFFRKKQRNLSEACALMRLSPKQIVRETATENNETLTTDFKVKVNNREHTLKVLFDIDKNRTIREITDESGGVLYGFDNACVLFAYDINNYYG